MTPNEVCGANINGNVHVHDNAAAMVVGSERFSACAGNIIGGDLQIHNNTAPAQVLNNSVTGTLDVHNNTANVQAVGNTVTGTLTCFNNSSITGGPNLDSNQAQGQCFQIQATTP